MKKLKSDHKISVLSFWVPDFSPWHVVTTLLNSVTYYSLGHILDEDEFNDTLFVEIQQEVRRFVYPRFDITRRSCVRHI